MRTLLPLAVALSTAVLSAQSPLTTTFAGGNGQSGNMFDIVGVTPVLITGFDIHLAGTADIEVYAVTAGTSYVGNEANAGAWTLLGSATGVVSAGAGVPTPLPIALTLPIGPGQTQGFYVTTTAGTLSYTNGTAAGAVYAQNADIQFLEGIGIAYPYGATFTPRIWNGNIYYLPGGPGTAAISQPVGAGCIADYASFYEQLPPSTFDLDGTTLTWLYTGAGYTIIGSLPGAIVPPTAAAINVAPGLLDGEQLFTLSAAMPIPGGSTSTLNVCTKGYIATNAGNGIDWTPTGAELCNFPQTTWALWHDFNQAASGSGLILFEEIGGIAYATWDGVYSLGAAAPNTFQFQFDTATGNITLVIDQMTGLGPNDQTVVGYSPGGPSLNPGNVDLSTVLAAGVIEVGVADTAPLAMASTSRPVLGTNWNLTVSAIPATTVFGATIYGLSDPAILDLGFLGMPECQLRASIDVIDVWVPAGTSYSFSFPVPATPVSLIGVELFAQAATFGVPPVNAFGAITSNAMKGTLGDL